MEYLHYEKKEQACFHQDKSLRLPDSVALATCSQYEALNNNVSWSKWQKMEFTCI